MVVPLELAFVAGSCRQLEHLQWFRDWDPIPTDTDIIVSALALNSLPCLKTLDMDGSDNVQPIVAGLATGASPLLEYFKACVGQDEQVPGVLAAIIQRFRHESCVPLRHLKLFQYVEEKELMKEFFACRLLAHVEELILGGHGQSWVDALVGYLEEGLARGKTRGMKRIQAAFSTDYPSGDAA